MSYIIFVLIFLAVCLFVLSYKNKYTIFLGFMIMSITGILFSMLNFIFKTGYYNHTSASYWGALDYSFYIKLSWLRLDYFSIIRMFNIFVALYMLSVVAFMFLYFRSVLDINKKRFYGILVFFFIFPLYTIWFYEPKISYLFYDSIHKYESILLKNFVFAVDIMNYVIMFLYIIAPLVLIMKSIKSKPEFINRKRSISILLCLMVVNVYFLITIFLGFFRKPYILQPNFVFIQRINNVYSSEFYMIFTIISVILIWITLYMVDKFSMTSKIGLVNRIIFRRSLKSLDRNYVNLFHSVKNIIYSYKLSVEKIRMTEGDAQKQAVDELEYKIDDYISRLTFMLDVVTENLEFETEKITIYDLVQDCLSTMDINDTVDVEMINRDSVCIDMDAFYMRDVVTNIVRNALDAIEKTEDERKGKLIFEITADGEWAVLKISDNGTGMSKKTKKNLFKTFYTTKSRVTNWGVGLSFSSKIVRFHGGYISVDSTINVGTDVYLYLPIKNANIRRKRIKKGL